MRDVERLREKVEFALDGKQVWALALSALLLLAGVFTIGLLIGRRTAPPPPPASGDLARMDRAAAQEKPGPPVAPPSAPPAERQAPAPGPQVPGPDKEARTAASQEEAPEKVAPGKAAPSRPAAVVPAPKPPTVVPPPPKPVQVASATPVALTPPPRDLGEFTVQIGASRDRGEALRMESRARAAGLKPYVVEADLGPKGTWYRVRVGVFKDRDAANRYRQDVERELRGPAVVMPSH